MPSGLVLAVKGIWLILFCSFHSFFNISGNFLYEAFTCVATCARARIARPKEETCSFDDSMLNITDHSWYVIRRPISSSSLNLVTFSLSASV